MKQKNKNFLFSNFDPQIEPRKILKSDLKIESTYNLNNSKGIIEPLCDFTNFFEDLFGNVNYQSFLTVNSELVSNIIYSTIYEYEETSTHEIQKRLFALDKNFYLYELNYETFELESLNINFQSYPTFLKQNGKLYIYLFNDNFVLISNDNSPICLTAVPNITNICNCAFSTYFTVNEDNFKIYYTEQSELENLSDELENYDYISLNPDGGKILKLLAYKDNIYVVQQYSISKIYTSSKTIRPQSNCEIKSKIYKNSICQIDDYIVFLSTAGLFVFDGNDIKQIFRNITNNLYDSNFYAISYNNHYYLSSKFDISGTLENVLLELDIENNISNIYKIGNICNLYEIQTYNFYEIIAVVKEGQQYKILRQNLAKLISNEKYLKFNRIFFDDHNIKVLNTLKLSCGGTFKISIYSEIDNVTFDVQDNFEINNIGLKGQWFEFEITGDDVSAFFIESIYVGVSYIEE